MTASSAHDEVARVVDGECSDLSRWISEVEDPEPTLTIDLGEATPVGAIEVYSGYGWPLTSAHHVLVDFTIEAHTAQGWELLGSYSDNTQSPVAWAGEVEADQVRLKVTNPSRSNPQVARVYEIVVRSEHF